MSTLRRFHWRLIPVWAGFALAAVATAVAVHRLYDTARREIAEQGARAAAEAQVQAVGRVRAAVDAIRRDTIAGLASFHVDGLGPALRRWDEDNPAVAGTFQWEAGRGFLPGAVIPEGAPADALPALWAHFREWRAQHPEATECEPSVVGSFRMRVVRTVGNPLFAADTLGYQAENLDILAYAGRPVDPWAGWAARVDDPAAPWVVWYQAGPEAAVRGGFVDIGALLAQLRGELGGGRLARVALIEAGAARPAPPAGDEAGLLDWLPAHALTADPGEAFLEKQADVRLRAVSVALLFALFLVGVAYLAIYSRREARDAERKTTFVSQVSHELRTPLTSIRMFADMLGRPGLPEEKRAKFAATIARESQRLGSLIERLLAFNALEKGTQPAAIEPVDVAALVRETLDEMDAALRDSGLRAETGLGDAAMAATDRSMLKQALINLLDNAAKYARDGGVVCVTLSGDDGMVRLRVADRGPGIPPALRRRVFEPFVQGRQSLTDKPAGVGLGLSIARGTLRQAGGDLVLLPGERGAVFEIRLPVARSP